MLKQPTIEQFHLFNKTHQKRTDKEHIVIMPFLLHKTLALTLSGLAGMAANS